MVTLMASKPGHSAAHGRAGLADFDFRRGRIGVLTASAPDVALIDMIYDAAVDPILWDQVLTGIADRLGSTSCILVGHQAGSWSEPRFGHFGRLDPEFNLRGSREDFARSPFMPKLASLGVGEIACSDEIMPLSEALRTPWYRDILTPQDIGHCLIAPLARGHGLFGAFFMARSRKRGAYSSQEAARLGRYIPHLHRATSLRCRLDAYRALARNQRDVLDAIEIGIILIDEAGAARCANGAAHEICLAGTGLKLRGTAIAVVDHDAGTRLNTLIATTAAGGPGGTLALRQRGLDEPLVLLVCPLRGAVCDTLSRPWEARQSVALFIKDPSRSCLAAAQQVTAGFYGLTPAEARVAALLAGGLGINGAAQKLSLSENTIKMHAKRVFEKIGVTSQVGLAGFYGRLAAPVRSNGEIAAAA